MNEITLYCGIKIRLQGICTLIFEVLEKQTKCLIGSVCLTKYERKLRDRAKRKKELMRKRLRALDKLEPNERLNKQTKINTS